MVKHNLLYTSLMEVRLRQMMTSTVIVCYGEQSRFPIGFVDFEAAMSLWVGSYGLRHRIILALIAVAPHHLDLIAKTLMRILDSIISTGKHCV